MGVIVSSLWTRGGEILMGRRVVMQWGGCGCGCGGGVGENAMIGLLDDNKDQDE